MPSKIIFSEQQLLSIRELSKRLTLKDLSKEMSVCEFVMRREVKKMGLKCATKKNTWATKQNANLDAILEMKDPHIIYCLGFLWGDGHLASPRNVCTGVRLAIVEKDFKSIKKSIIRLGKCNIYHTHRRIKWKPQTTWVLNDIRLADFLFQNDYHKKSFVCPKKILEKIPDNLKHFWWRGFFEADGCLYVKGGIPKQLFFGGQYDYDWKLPLEFFSKMGLVFHVKHKISKTGNCSLFSCFKQVDMLSFLNYIYEGVKKDKIGLKRKSKKFIELKSFKPKEKTSKHKYVMYAKVGDGEKRKWLFVFDRKGYALVRKSFESEEEAVLYKTEFFNANPSLEHLPRPYTSASGGRDLRC